MRNRKILIVDDNDSLHDVFKDFFELQGYCAETAMNGLEGVRKYRTSRPDIVLMDVQMPVMNGYESSKEIKDYDPDAKILMVTAYPQDPLAMKSIHEGYVTTIIAKPCNLESLHKMVNQTLAA